MADHLAVGCGRQGSTLRALAQVTEGNDRANARTLGGLAADAPLGRWSSLEERLDRGRHGAEDFYADLRAHITRHEMPADMRTEPEKRDEWDWPEDDAPDRGPSEGETWLANRTWGRAIQIKQDHLRESGVTGREYAQAMWEWKDQLEQQARRLGEPLPFSADIAGKEPYLGEVYRGDERSRDTIFEEGFRPWSDKREEGWIIPHDDRAGDRGDTSDHVWTSKNPDVAAVYADGSQRQVYVVQDAPRSLDMNNRYGADYEVHHAEEVVFRGGVPADKIKGELIDPDDIGAGIIPNPGFTPYEPAPIRPPREDGD